MTLTSNVRKAGQLFLLTAFAAMILAFAGCQQQAPKQAPDTRAQDETAIREAEAGMEKAVAAGDAAKAVSFYTDDVVGMSADSPVTQGKENALKYFEGMLKDKPEISWTPSQVEVARSGDLGYSWGAGKVIEKDKKGKPVETTMKYVSVWKKQADGSWKIAVDSLIPDPPAKKK
jgi:uncharacterized protein (TIGR02246 family)